MAGKVVDLAPSTIRKLRDQNGWVAPIDRDKNVGGKNNTTVTMDIANRLAYGWRQKLGDNCVAIIAGVGKRQLAMWLEDNIEVTVQRTRENGTVFYDKVGLRDLRDKERIQLESDYLTLHEKAIKECLRREKKGDPNSPMSDPRGAMKGIQWRLEKTDPKKYGTRALIEGDTNVEINTQVQVNQITIDDLDLSLEERKSLLAKLRAKQIEGETA